MPVATAQNERDELLQLIECANAPIFGIDVGGNVNEWNKTTARITGFSKEEAMGKPLVKTYIDADKQAAVHGVLEQALEGIQTANYELPLTTKDGRVRHLLINATTRRGVDGQVTGVVGVAQDITDLKRVEDEASLKARELRQLIETAYAPIFGIDINGNVLEWNDTTARISGFSKEEAMGKNLVDTFIDEDKKSTVADVLRKALGGDPTANYELPLTTKDGRVRHLLVNATTRRGVDGKVTGVVGVAQDITDLKRVEAEASLKARELRQLVETANAPIFGIGVNGNVTEWNDSTARITGYSKGETMGKPLVKTYIDADKQTAVHGVLERALAGHQTSNYELPLTTKDGRTRHLLINATTRRGVTGEVTGVVGVAQDITELLEAQQNIKQNAVLKDVYSEMPGVVCFEVFEPGGPNEKHFWVAGAVEKLFGFSKDEWLEESPFFGQVLHEESKGVALRATSALFRGESCPMAELHLTNRKDGHDVWMRMDKNSRALDNGNMLIVLHDVTAEVLLREMTKKRDIQKAIAERFKAACAFMSHEIRNQLFPQSVVLEDMKDESPEWTESIDQILEANVTVTTILNRVLELAKWESGEFPINRTLFAVMDLFKAIASYAIAKGATVKGIDAVQSTWYCAADRHILKQAATNLVSNASKFRNGTPFSVQFEFQRLSKAQGTLVVTVTDGGKGLTPEELVKVMIPFGQIRKAGEQQQGTGLGLPLAKAMIEHGHGGSLTLHSKGRGTGCTATMRVPVQWVEQGNAPVDVQDELYWVEVDEEAMVDVLIVDDVRVNCDVLGNSAKRLGLTYATATDGEVALSMLRPGGLRFSVVLMDRQMPNMNGDIAVAQARRAGYTGAIAMLTGDTFEPCEKEAIIAMGVTAILTKMAVPGARHVLKRLAKLKKEKAAAAAAAAK